MAHNQSGMEVQNLFGNERIGSYVKPPIQFTITIEYVEEICKEMLNILQNEYQVQIFPKDLITLISVIKLQLEAKMWYSTRSTEFAVADSEIEERVEQVERVFPRTILPFAYYLAQIGRVELNGQIMIPKIVDLYNCSVSENIIVLEENNPLTDAKQWAKILDIEKAVTANIIMREDNRKIFFTPEFIRNPREFNWVGIVSFGPPKKPPIKGLPYEIQFNDLIHDYNELIGHILRRVSYDVVCIDFKANGTPAQLVTSKSFHETDHLSWSFRDIDTKYLYLGCIFRYGYGLENYDASHLYNSRVCEAIIQPAGPLLRFLNKYTIL